MLLKHWGRCLSLEEIVRSAGKFVKENRSFFTGAALLAGSCIADAYISSKFINAYGLEAELNFTVRYFVGKLGTAGVYLHKALLATPLFYMTWKGKANWPLYAGSATCMFDALSWYLWA